MLTVSTDKRPPRWRFALKMAGAHLLISMLLAALAAWLVFGVWYPYPYAELTGGLALYRLLVGVDVVCGPLLTLILASPAKTVRERWVDFSLIGAIQLAALFYGLYSVSLARPVVAAFESDRINVVTAAEVLHQDLVKAPAGLRNLSWFGVRRVGLRQPQNTDEANKSLDLSLQGIEPSMRPDMWVADGASERRKIADQMQPLAVLAKSRGLSEDEILAMAKTDKPTAAEALYFLPFTSSLSKDWVVILNRQADFLGYVPIDGFVGPRNRPSEK